MSDNRLELSISHDLETAVGKMTMEVSFSALSGNIMAITGPSGAGKTTLLRHIAGLVHPKTGHIRFGQNTWLDLHSKINVKPQHRNIGFVFQDYALFPNLTVRENLSYALEKGAPNDIIDELLAEIDLAQLADRKPFQLSGGQQQRVALARALVRNPKLLLLDEPLSALDHVMRANLQDLILRFHAKLGFTMIIITHDLGEIFRLANQVIVLENGKIINQGTPADVYLAEKTSDNDRTLYGEVLSSEIQSEFVVVHALIEQRIEVLKLPLNMAPQLSGGKSFVLTYSLEGTNFRLIGN